MERHSKVEYGTLDIRYYTSTDDMYYLCDWRALMSVLERLSEEYPLLDMHLIRRRDPLGNGGAPTTWLGRPGGSFVAYAHRLFEYYDVFPEQRAGWPNLDDRTRDLIVTNRYIDGDQLNPIARTELIRFRAIAAAVLL